MNIDIGNKKGVIVIGTPRSGSHMLTDMLFQQSKDPNAYWLGEITANADFSIDYFKKIELEHQGKIIFCSIVQHWIKRILAMDPSCLKDYVLINLRRRDKVAQYISWCVFQAQTSASMVKHSPDWDDYKQYLPIETTRERLNNFIDEQNLDFAFTNPDYVVYYEDVVQLDLPSNFKKNHYPIPKEQIVGDFDTVKSLLEKYSYDNR